METYYLGKQTTDSAATHLLTDRWRPLVLLNIFRILIATVFCLLYLTKNLLPPFGAFDALLFFKASIGYFLIGLILAIFHLFKRIPFALHVYTSVFVDVVFLVTLMHASGGIESGIGVLLIVTIAAGSIVMGGRTALGFAALAAIAVLVQQSYLSINYPGKENYPAAGLLGFTYFISAIVFVFLARRIRESEALARKRGFDLANLAQLTEHIIQRMQTGVLVIDQDGIIRLINESAAQMLGIGDQQTNLHIRKIAPDLAEQWEKWTKDPDRNPEMIRLTHNPIDISPRFALIGDQANAGALVFLQDMASMAQQAQQLQLASLGRLTASIAHEIRNPLGAISHAGQLLAESDRLDQHERRMTQIISDHTQRLNTIVENVMSLSRRKSSHIELFKLKTFLEKFVTDYTSGQGYTKKTIQIEIEPDDTQVRFDSGHLQQILINLCDNGIRYSMQSPQETKIYMRGGLMPGATRPHLDIIDQGPGISNEVLENLFQPFFTTETRGTGLGLYLSRELAEGNQAHLNYVKPQNEKSFFRITFQDPRRQFD